MKFIFSTFAVFALGLNILTGCQNAAPPVQTTETAKTTEASKTTNTNTQAPNAAPVDEHGHADAAERISLADAKKEFDAGNAVFIDTRAETSYNNERIKGAINITENNVEEKYKDIPQGKKVIAYCSWPNEHSSASLVTKLKEKGIKNSYALVGGTAAWKNAGYPMETGAAKPK